MNLFFYYFYCLFFAFSRAAPVAYGGSLARGPIGAEAASLHHHSHSNTMNLNVTTHKTGANADLYTCA